MNSLASWYSSFRYFSFFLASFLLIFLVCPPLVSQESGGADVNIPVQATPDEVTEAVKTAILTAGSGLSQKEALEYAEVLVLSAKGDWAEVAELATHSLHEVAGTLGMLSRLEMVCNGDYSGAAYDAMVEGLTELMKASGYGGPAMVSVGLVLSALKTTRDSFVAVADTKKELNIEILYYRIEADKGVTPQGGLPVFSNENLEKLYQKLWVNGDKQLLRDYASLRLPDSSILPSNFMTEGVIETLRPGQNKENVLKVIASVMADVKIVRQKRLEAAANAIEAAKRRKAARIALAKARKAYRIVSEMNLAKTLATASQINEAQQVYHRAVQQFDKTRALKSPKTEHQANQRGESWNRIALLFTTVVHNTRLLYRDSQVALQLYNSAVEKESESKDYALQFGQLAASLKDSPTPSTATDTPTTPTNATAGEPPAPKIVQCKTGTVPLHYSAPPNAIWKCQKECDDTEESIYYTETVFESGTLLERETLSCRPGMADDEPPQKPELPELQCEPPTKKALRYNDKNQEYETICEDNIESNPAVCVQGAPGCAGYKPPSINFNAPKENSMSYGELFAISPEFAKPFRTLYYQGKTLADNALQHRERMVQIYQRQYRMVDKMARICSNKLINDAGKNTSLFSLPSMRKASVFATEDIDAYEVNPNLLQKDLKTLQRLLARLTGADKRSARLQRQYAFAIDDMTAAALLFADSANRYLKWKNQNKRAFKIINDNIASLIPATQHQIDTGTGPEPLPQQLKLDLDEATVLSSSCDEIRHSIDIIGTNERKLFAVVATLTANRNADKNTFLAFEKGTSTAKGPTSASAAFPSDQLVMLAEQITQFEKRLLGNTLHIITVIDGRVVQDETIAIVAKGTMDKLQQLKLLLQPTINASFGIAQKHTDTLSALKVILGKLKQLTPDAANFNKMNELMMSAFTLPDLFTGEMDATGAPTVFPELETAFKEIMSLQQRFIDAQMASHPHP
ncbi:MAG: hypothetical protein JXX29_19130 [Deltaproteobacteria bacterium]|nr:hypothetical protein [Deltaproteobacteria bacterium]MBN2673801.1 hypothetical protein [Deltaproteobacteria bacterium]